MNILLVSQCHKNALRETRRILDQFAERRGDRTWQTPITQAGLDTLRKMLRKTARKNTAVACHWIRGLNHSELLWVVGNASRFNARGTTPIHATRNDILRRADENDWHTLTDIHLLASLAALFHDFGKACDAFQNKLKGQDRTRNRYRHEWISLRLLQALVGTDAQDDAEWLARLASPDTIDEAAWLDRLIRDGQTRDIAPLPLAELPPIARTVGWLIVSHHRLPVLPSRDEQGQQQFVGRKSNYTNADALPTLPDAINAAWNEIDAPDDADLIAPYWRFSHGLPSRSTAWCKRARRVARQALARRDNLRCTGLSNVYATHIARFCLMLADHHYSSQSDDARRRPTLGDSDHPLFANTARDGQLAQRLDDHLLGVTQEVGTIAHRLPDTLAALPRIARHKGFRKRSTNSRFRWQDRAFDLAASLRDISARQGFFGINMASTGCGKTLANGRICYALADLGRGTRFTVALGLRTLTLQTGNAYRRDLRLSSDDLAIRVGGQASRALFAHREAQLDAQGRSSAEPLFDTDSYVRFDGRIDDHPLLSRVVASPQARALITAPIAVCTIDHLMPATESLRGGSQIPPMLRLMGADLVLDEPDDFGMEDLPALCRLVYWTGLLGSRVILSSATLPPAMVEGLYRAYRAGRMEYQKNRGEPGTPTDICCAWFDEYCSTHHNCADGDQFRQHHDAFAAQRTVSLAQNPAIRRAMIAPVTIQTCQRDRLPDEMATILIDHALALHAQHHETDPQTGHRVSFGLIRMANIGPLFDIARALYAQDAPDGIHIHLCVYHSQFPLLSRSAIEHCLDTTLDRRQPGAVYERPDIRRQLDACTHPDHLFIVLGSPVTEVGRDHDYDWAVVEPSSMRSIIQLAGRVQRHRQCVAQTPNIVLLDRNWNAIAGTHDNLIFCRPGFENSDHQLAHRQLSALLDETEYTTIDSRPRLTARPTLDARHSLVDLEHARMASALLAPKPPGVSAQPPQTSSTGRRRRRAADEPSETLEAYSAYTRPSLWLTGILAQQQRFREQTQRQVDLVVLPTEDETDVRLVRLEPQRGGPPLETEVEARLHHPLDDTDMTAERITPWANTDYLAELGTLAEARDLSLIECARRFGTLQLPENDVGWSSHPVLGFRKS